MFSGSSKNWLLLWTGWALFNFPKPEVPEIMTYKYVVVCCVYFIINILIFKHQPPRMKAATCDIISPPGVAVLFNLTMWLAGPRNKEQENNIDRGRMTSLRIVDVMTQLVVFFLKANKINIYHIELLYINSACIVLLL